MKNLTELLKSKDVGIAEGLVNLFVSAAVRGAVTTFVFFVVEGTVFVVTKALRKQNSNKHNLITFKRPEQL